MKGIEEVYTSLDKIYLEAYHVSEEQHSRRYFLASSDRSAFNLAKEKVQEFNDIASQKLYTQFKNFPPKIQCNSDNENS